MLYATVLNGKKLSPSKISADSVSNSKTLLKNETLSNPETLKPIFKNLSKNSALSKTEAVSENDKPISCQTYTTFQRANTIGHNVGSYTQGRIAGDFLSSRKAARAERYTPKTTAAALDG
jgi:hypothetical protein